MGDASVQSGHDHIATSEEQQAQQIKTTYLKHKTLHNPICIIEQGLATTGWAAEEARADEESGSE